MQGVQVILTGLSGKPSTGSPQSDAARLIFGTGEMADLVRAFDWASTPLGPIETWPESLLTSVNTVLGSRHPLFLWWGKELVQFYNDAYRPSLGNKHPAALGQRGAACWAEVWAAISPQIEAVMERGESTWNEDRYLPVYRSGEALEDAYWTFSYSPVRDASGVVRGVFVVVSETTARVRTETELHARARELRESQRIGRMGSWRLVLATGELTWSDEVYRLTDHDPSLPVLNFAEQPEIMEPQSLRRLEAAVEHCISTGEGYEIDTRMLLPSGRSVWFATRGEAVYDFDGKVVELRGTVRDITDRKLAEETLRSSEERLQLALETACLGTWVYDAATDLSTGDAAMMGIFGSTRATGDFEYWVQFVHPDDRERVGEEFRAATGGERPYESEYRIVRPADGETRWIRSRGRVLREADRPLRMVVIVEDITDRVLAERALLHNEKLAAVGRLASSIAHEINNPLESVMNLLYLARSSAANADAVEYLGLAEQELRRAAAITSTTLRFHRQSTRPAEVLCDELIEGVLGMHRSRMRNAGIVVEQRQRAGRPVLCSDGEIRQVLSNLVGNATDAMQHSGGRLLLRSREAHDWTTGRAGVAVTVADTGPGMSRATVAHAFEAFYTTKGMSGTGLGLWISKEIVERHRGRLRVRSSQRPGRSGTVFTLFLPHVGDARQGEAAQLAG